MNLVSIVRQTSVLASIVLASLLIYSNQASAQQRACVITDEGATVYGKLTTLNKKPNQSLGQRKEVDKFVFLLKGCRRSDTTIKCNLSIINKGAERELYIRADRSTSTIIDSSGKSYSGSTVEIGGQIGSEGLTTIISPGIDYIAEINFENVSEQIAQAPVLNLYLHRQKVQFRNVSFSN
jgi:hypothetical protein